MSRTVFATIILVLSAAAGAFAQSISVYSRTTILANGQVMAECGTAMNDSSTMNLYASVEAWCGFYINSNKFEDFDCPASRPTYKCYKIYSTQPGMTYATSSSHSIDLYFLQLCGYYDPFDYGFPLSSPISIIPRFEDSGLRVGNSARATCWTGPNLLIAFTDGHDKQTTKVSPSQVTLYESQSQQFTANKDVTWSLQGNGQLVGGLYAAPAQISDGESAVVQACDSQSSADCDKATITLKNATVTVTPTGQEELPIPTKPITFTAAILPGTLSQELTWSQTPTGVGNIANGVYTPPTNDDPRIPAIITVQACSKNLTSLCGTATVSVPKVDITVVPSPPSAFLAVPGNSFTMGANVLGPSTSREVNLVVSPGTSTPQGFNTILYTPPTTPTITVSQPATIHVCLKASPAICADPEPRMILVAPITINSPGVWNAGTTNSVRITGTGFGAAPEVKLSDPNITFSYGLRTDTAIALTAIVPVSSGGQPLTVEVGSSPTEGVAPSPASVTVTPTKAILTITPTSAQLREGQTQTFTTTCMAAGAPCTAPSSPTWIAALGAFSAPGATNISYTAPPSVNGTAATIQVKACWSVVPQQCATAVVTVNPLTVTVTPASANVNGCSTKQFNVQVTNAAVQTVIWNVVSPVGNVDPNGFYTAPCPVTAQTQIQVQACSTENTQRCGTSNVTLMPVSLTVSPQTASVQPSGIQQFSTVVLNSTNLGVTWSLTPAVSAAGSIDANGLYRAPSAITVTSVTVTATSKADNATKGTAQVLLVNPNAGLSPATLTFAAQDVGTTSPAQTITLSNPGTAAFSLSSITTTGEFTQTNHCGGSLAPGGSCTISVQFMPTAIGVRTGTLRIMDSAPGSPHIASLNGTGSPTTLSSISISPASVTVGSSPTGTVTMSSAVSTNTSVTLSSNDLSATVPTSVTVPAGAATANFPISTNTSNCAPLTATINATYNGTSKQANLAVNPATSGFAGYHDSVDTSGIAVGWAWDANNPACRTQVDFYLDGTTFLRTFTANEFRQDLSQIGDGYHAWGYVLPSPPLDGLAHTLTAKHHTTGAAEASSPRGFAYNVPIFPTQTPNAVHCCDITEVGTWFHSSATGVIKALRFYQSANETGGTANNHTVRLWSSSGTLLASVVIPFTAGAGWREGTLATPYPIAANTDYVVSYGINHELAQYSCTPAFPFSNTVTKGNYTLTLTATQTKYTLTQGQFPNTAACSNPFIDIKFYAGTQTGSAF